MATSLVRIQARRNTAAQWGTSNEVLLPGELGYETDTNLFKIGDGTTGWNARPYATDRFGVFNVRNYGAKGDGTSDDTAAFQAAATAAIAVGGTLVIPPAPTAYLLTSTIALAPAGGGTQFALNIDGAGNYSSIRWGGGSNAAVFSAVGWKLSHVNSVKIDFTSTTATGVIGWDLDTTSVAQSLTHVSFNNCFVGLSGRTGAVGWRLGHLSGGGGDVSFLQWNQCLVNGTLGAAQRGWINEGRNSLNNVWVNCFGYGLDKLVTNLSDTGATSGQGDDSMFFYGMGGSGNAVDFEFAVPGAYLISGGRFELGKRFLNVTNASNHPAVTVQGANISSYAPTDGILVNFDRPGTLTWDGNYVRYGTTGAYTANAFKMAGFTNVGQLIVRGGGIAAADPFYTVGSNWQVWVQGVGNLTNTGSPTRMTTRLGDTATVLASSVNPPKVATMTLTEQTTGTTITPTLPAGTANGDILVLTVATTTSSITTPTGWTLISGQQVFGGGAFLGVYWKAANGFDTMPAVTVAGRTTATVYRITGANTTTPVGSNVHTQATSDVTSVKLYATATTASAVFLTAVAMNSTAVALVPPTTGAVAGPADTGTGYRLGTTWQTAPALFSGDNVWTNNPATAARFFGVIFAIKS